MIDKTKAEEIVIQYLNANGNTLVIIPSIEAFEKKDQSPIPFGDEKGKIDDIWTVSYEVPWDQFTRNYFVFLSATTGEIYGILGPHGHRLP